MPDLNYEHTESSGRRKAGEDPLNPSEFEGPVYDDLAAIPEQFTRLLINPEQSNALH